MTLSPRERATVAAALALWSDRNVPATRLEWSLRLAEFELLASGGRQFPALDAEETEALIRRVREAKTFSQ